MNYVVIIANLFGNNRQGYDLADALRTQGCKVRLVQYTDISDRARGNIGVGYVKPHGFFSKFHVLCNLLRIFFGAWTARREVVVCIGRPLLPIAFFLKILSHSDLVYYSLEYCRYSALQKWILMHGVDRYIDVEESRLDRMSKEFCLKVPTYVMYNLPTLSPEENAAGHLREYLKTKCHARGDEKIALYAGSYQSYACLERIYRASESFPDNVLLVLMVARGLPESCNHETARCKIVPAQSGQEFFNWASDADCSLLPYEDKRDFNVMNCSPQKLFDCYRMGVPYLASDRPIIRKIHGIFEGAGAFCDFTNEDDIVKGVVNAVTLKTTMVSRRMIELYQSEYNYTRYAPALARFVLRGNV